MESPEQLPTETAAVTSCEAGRATILSVPAGRRLAIVLLNSVPFLHLIATVLVIAWPWAGVGWRITAALGVLYLVPAVIGRLIVRGFPIRSTVISPGSSDFIKWWALLNLQVLFCRLPALEELVRLVPWAYSGWLRLWGSRIGRMIYWSAGTRILDRSFLDIGDDVVFGAGVRLNPHVMARNDKGEMELILAPVKIGPRSVIGGYALLTAGTVIAADESTRACLQLPPFTRWQNGQRARE